MAQKKIEKEFEAKKPDYTAAGIAVWKNRTEKGEYLTIKLVGHTTMTAFENKNEKS